MASEQDELLKQLKEIVESLKSVGQYSKDLSAAVAAANRPMQQMSDYSKAIGEQMKAVATNMEESKEALTGMSTDMGDLLNKIGQVNQGESESTRLLHEKQAALAAQKTETEALRATHIAIQVEQDKFWTAETLKGKERNEALEKTGSLWDQIKKKAHDYQTELAKESSLKQTMGASAAQGLTGQSSFQGALGSMSTAVSSLLPTAGGIGGLIGMMLYGKMREAEFNALGETIGQQFDAVGGHTAKFSSRMGGLSKDLSAYGMIAKEDFAKVAASMASVGMTQEDAETKIKGFRNAAGTDFMAFSLSMDKAFEMAAGTTAKLAGVLKRDFGQSTKEAAENLQLMASSAKETGANVTTFMQQVMDASSSIRLMHANMSSIITLQTASSKSFQRMGLGVQQANEYAAEGTKQVAGALGGMDKGVMAILAQRMGLGNGDAGDALAQYRSMAARGGSELDTERMMKEMVKLMEESGATTEFQKQEFGAGVLGLGVAGVDALMRGVKEMEGGGHASDDTMNTLKGALGMEAKKTSVMERLVNEIKNAVADVMVGLLGMIVNGLKLLYNGVMAGFYMLRDALPGGTKDDAAKAKAYLENVSFATAGMGVAAKKMQGGISQLPGTAQEALGASGLSGGWTIEQGKEPAPEFYSREKELRTHLKKLEKSGVKGSSLIKAQREWEMQHEAAAETYSGSGSVTKDVVAGDERLEVTIKKQGSGRGNKDMGGAPRSKK